MSVSLTVAEIRGRMLLEAYALIRTLMPEVTQGVWLRYAKRLAQEGGALGAFCETGALFGVLTWRRQDCLRHGNALLIENFITFELSQAAPVRKALRDAVERLAAEQVCSAIKLVIGARRGGEPNVTSSWASLGYVLDEMVLTRGPEAGCMHSSSEPKAETLAV